jgi:predicted AAA+ superfamily ATPase
LFGPRATGKTFLIHEQLADRALIIDLLRSDLFLRLSASLSDLEALIAAHGPSFVVVIDEVQKVPPLLDEVHRLMERKGLKFLLTGSSARKLRRGQANLLAGRAWQANLFPLTWIELKEQQFVLDRYLRYGGLPTVYLSRGPARRAARLCQYLFLRRDSGRGVGQAPATVRPVSPGGGAQ